MLLPEASCTVERRFCDRLLARAFPKSAYLWWRREMTWQEKCTSLPYKMAKECYTKVRQKIQSRIAPTTRWQMNNKHVRENT